MRIKVDTHANPYMSTVEVYNNSGDLLITREILLLDVDTRQEMIIAIMVELRDIKLSRLDGLCEFLFE